MSGDADIRNAERRRLEEEARRDKNWKRWGPYLAERQWGTVREDYSANGDAWGYFPYEQSLSRAYRWGEDGLLGVTDRECRLCFALALWNGEDPHLKERLFGLANGEGNHGEDVKEAYFYLDASPTYSYMKALYKYPHAAFPYRRLREENGRRGYGDPEFELADTGVFDESRYFDVFAEYAKGGPNDLLIRVTIANRGPDAANLTVLPTLWFRNTWIWGCKHEGCTVKPRMERARNGRVKTAHPTLGVFHWDPGYDGDERPALLFTDNETNAERVFGAKNAAPYVKDAFHDYVVHRLPASVNPEPVGTKAAALYEMTLEPGEERVLRMRLYHDDEPVEEPLGAGFESAFASRQAETDAYYDQVITPELTDAERRVSRQAYAGLLWTKQFYNYIIEDWLHGDPETPPPPPERKQGRNNDWRHLFNRDVLSMPDKWEYPWYAAWDLAFHMLPMARVDPVYAQEQLILLLREWYMHPNGQLPAYEYNFSDVNPPVHAWACWRVYKIAGERGERDRSFLASAFQKLLLNFTWWVNRKDPGGKHVFSGGFLGLDNIGVFDRSQPMPGGGHLRQADGTAWMAFYCTTMLAMALELAQDEPAYEDMASKFFEHFVSIADAMNALGGHGLWHEEDRFYYDQAWWNGHAMPLRVRSLVGLLPLIAVETVERDVLERLPGFHKRTSWFLENRPDLARQVTLMAGEDHAGEHERLLLAIPSRERLEPVLAYLLDEDEFLSPYGVRSLSKAHREAPFTFDCHGERYTVSYVPGESDSGMFGGNSNWRGPVWFPINFLILEALERYHRFYGDSLQVELPTGSGRRVTLDVVADELAARLAALFLPTQDGPEPWRGADAPFANDPHWRDYALFHEYFHGDTGRGLGASHQTGWTSLVAHCLEHAASRR